ncbi:MAG: hypothetical protein R3E83_13320 [Burkholderiaceae bacterium]
MSRDQYQESISKLSNAASGFSALASSLADIWRIMQGRGFDLFQLAIDHIDSLRDRPFGEFSYRVCFQEEAKERFTHPDGSWMIRSRKSMSSLGYRSEYLDLLEQNWGIGVYGHLGRRLKHILDPNLLLYARLKNQNIDCWTKFVADYNLSLRRSISQQDPLISSLERDFRRRSLHGEEALMSALIDDPAFSSCAPQVPNGAYSFAKDALIKPAHLG